MKKNTDKKRNILIMVFYIIIALGVVIGVTYAFFQVNIKNNKDSDESVSVKGSKLELTYGDGNGLLSMDHLKPNTNVGEKTFTVTNTGKSDVDDYEVILESVINDLNFHQDLTYELTCVSDVGSICQGNNDTFPKRDRVLVSNRIAVGETHTYSLSIFYKETYQDQSEDLGKTVSAKVNIQDNTHMGE